MTGAGPVGDANAETATAPDSIKDHANRAAES
jgi:hypothetical protein